jgi:hypothetical protein
MAPQHEIRRRAVMSPDRLNAYKNRALCSDFESCPETTERHSVIPDASYKCRE